MNDELTHENLSPIDNFWNSLCTKEKNDLICIALNTARDWNGINKPQFIQTIFNCSNYYLPIIIKLNNYYYKNNDL